MDPRPHALPALVSARPFVDIVWTVTDVCPWDCQVCSVDAVHVRLVGHEVELRSRGLTHSELLPKAPGVSYLDVGVAARQAAGHELTLDEKMRVLDNLSEFDAKIDFSGGDPLTSSETIHVMRAAARKFGVHNVTLTATGPGFARVDPRELVGVCGEVNFTFDGVASVSHELRPRNYASSNLRMARRLLDAGVQVRAEYPMSIANIDASSIEAAYVELHEAGVPTLLLMRLFPVGRATELRRSVPTSGGYASAIDRFRALERQHGLPKVRLQCALRGAFGARTEANPCDLVRESFGLNARGMLLASPWASSGPDGEALGKEWVLGNLSQTGLRAILASPEVVSLRSQLDKNWGHCKVFSFLHSRAQDGTARMLDNADPLMLETESVRRVVRRGPA